MARPTYESNMSALMNSLPERQAAMAEKIQLLEQANRVLQKNFDTVSNDLLLATQLSLGRMLIEAAIAANDLRDSLLNLNEANLEEGELVGDHEPGVNIWKKRLDKMLLKISQAHQKADEECQEVADKISGMKKEMERTQIEIADTYTPLRRPKRPRDLGEVNYTNEDGMESDNGRKKPRYEENIHQFKQEPIHPTAFQEPDSYGSQLRVIQPSHNTLSVKFMPLEHNTVRDDQGHESPVSAKTHQIVPDHLSLPDVKLSMDNHDIGGMHRDRQRLINSIKIEEGVKEPTVSHAPSGGSKKVQWRDAYLSMGITQEESDWLMIGPKSEWQNGGWTDRQVWLHFVMDEYRRLQAMATTQAEADANATTLSYRLRKGEFTPSLFGM